MADNITLDAGSGGATLRTDDDGTAHWQYVKLAYGADNTQTIVAAASGLPVTWAGTDPPIGAGTEAAALRVTVATDSTGVLSIDDGGNVITVDGTVTANLGATDNAVLDSIDTAVNGTLTVGSHAVTNEGTFVVQVDGNALTALQLIDDPVFADDAAFTLTSSKVMMSGAIVDAVTSALAAVDGDAVPLRVDGNGCLWTRATIQGTGSFNLEQVDSTTVATGAGNADGGTQRVSISSDDVNLSGILTAVQIMDDWDETNRCAVNVISGQAGIAGGTGVDGATVPRFTLATDVALPAGTNAIGKLAANSGVDIGDVDVTSISAGSNLIGDVGISGARTSGGTTLYKNIDVDESEDEVKGSAGQVYWIHAMNLASSVRYLKLYNATAASVTVGTTTPDLTFPIPTQGDTNGAGFMLPIPNGIAFSTAITVAATTGVADNDSGAPSANEVILNMGYA